LTVQRAYGRGGWLNQGEIKEAPPVSA